VASQPVIGPVSSESAQAWGIGLFAARLWLTYAFGSSTGFVEANLEPAAIDS